MQTQPVRDETSRSRYADTLKRALDIVGDEHRLATMLKTTPRVLRRWLAGRAQPPTNTYLLALQLVTDSGKSEDAR